MRYVIMHYYIIVNMQENCVNMEENHVYLEDNYVNMRDNHVDKKKVAIFFLENLNIIWVQWLINAGQ